MLYPGGGRGGQGRPGQGHRDAAVRSDRQRTPGVPRRVHDRAARRQRLVPFVADGAGEVHGRQSASMRTSSSSGSTPTPTCTTCSRTCRRCAGPAARSPAAAAGQGGRGGNARRPDRRHTPAAASSRPRCSRRRPTAGRRITATTPASVTAGSRRSRRRTSTSSRSPGRSRRAWRDAIKATPILVNGIIYLTTPDNLWAIDARTGRQIWRYTYPDEHGLPHRPPRRGGVQGHGLPDDARLRTSSRSTRGRQGEVERRDRGLRRRATGPRTRRCSSAIT